MPINESLTEKAYFSLARLCSLLDRNLDLCGQYVPGCGKPCSCIEVSSYRGEADECPSQAHGDRSGPSVDQHSLSGSEVTRVCHSLT